MNKPYKSTQRTVTVGTSYARTHGPEVILLYKLRGYTGIFVDPYHGPSPFVKARYEFDENSECIILHEMDRYESITEALQKIKNPLELHVTVTYHCRSCDKIEYKDYTVTDVSTLADILSDTKSMCPDCGKGTYFPIEVSRDDNVESFCF